MKKLILLLGFITMIGCTQANAAYQEDEYYNPVEGAWERVSESIIKEISIFDSNFICNVIHISNNVIVDEMELPYTIDKDHIMITRNDYTFKYKYSIIENSMTFIDEYSNVTLNFVRIETD